MISCDGFNSTVSCGSEAHINIIDAFHGRNNEYICLDPSINDINCKLGSFVSNIKILCNNQTSCDALSAITSDPCQGTYKFIRIAYECLRKESTQMTSNYIKIKIIQV